MKTYTMLRTPFLICLSLFLTLSVLAQDETSKVLQFSGQIFYEGKGKQMIPLTYATVYIDGTTRGTVSDFDGFFSLPVRTGERVIFKYLGFQDASLTIPDTLTEDRYYSMIMMAEDTLDFQPVVILPWPSKEHFDIEFAAMDVTNDLEERANANLSETVMAEFREKLNYDGQENFNQFMKEKQADYYAAGQTRPMHILNPLAWAKFIEEWKSGKYKRKRKK